MSEFYDISREITSDLGIKLTVRPYCAIIDASGEICHMDSELEEYSGLIKDFLKISFRMLKVGDHSVPLSETNMIFFKISEKAMVILFTRKGALGQLLAFKPMMPRFQKKIDALIDDEKIIKTRDLKEELKKEKDIVEHSIEKEDKKKKKFLPLLIKDLGETKIPIEHASILNLCNGKNDVESIVKESKKDRLYINNIIRQYQKQGYIKLKKVS